MRYGKLQTASREWGVHFRTILSWAKSGKIQSKLQPSGVRKYELPTTLSLNKKTIGYIRVSSYSQKENLLRQQELLLQQYPDVELVSEIASGLNFRRKKLWAIMESVFRGDVSCIVVTHKDRLARFGFEFIQKVVGHFGCEILVLNQTVTSPEQELVQDILSILHVFSSRLYGLRKYSNELKSIQDGLKQSAKKKTEILDVSE